MPNRWHCLSNRHTPDDHINFMSVKFYCFCGKKLKAAAEHSGRRGQCTSCGRAVVIPSVSETSPPTPPSTPIEAPWYFARNGQMFGPLAPHDLRELVAARRLLPNDWVLSPGASQWIAAQDIGELFPEQPLRPIAVESPSPSTEEATILGVQFDSRRHVLAEAQVVPDASRCVQCGICSYNCPMGIDVRAHAWRGRPIHDSRCLTCSECVNRCPRGVLQFERLSLFGVET